MINGATQITYTVKAITGVYDFTLAADPAYPDTSVEAREFTAGLRENEKPAPTPEPQPDKEKMRKQVREMRRAATQSIY